jgi:hypothetical protein
MDEIKTIDAEKYIPSVDAFVNGTATRKELPEGV